MYEWRRMREEEREQVLVRRQRHKLPWHSVPHLEYHGTFRFIFTAACYEHFPIIGNQTERLAECEKDILTIFQEHEAQIFAWCFLPNHYHLLLETDRIKELRKAVGRYNGRTARSWNLEDNSVGRKVWYNFFERPMKSTGHFWASLNYIHHNPVKHGYVERWQDWPYTSVHQYLESVGRERALEIWREYPVLDYGKDWDR